MHLNDRCSVPINYLKGSMDMATSSIIENIKINNPQVLEEYVAAMEVSAKEPLKHRTEDQHSGVVTDSTRIRRFAEKALAKKCKKL